MQIQTNLAKQVDIIDYLRSIGVQVPQTAKAQILVAATWRGDKCPSVSVNTEKNIWHDFGTGEGGSIIDLVMAVERCDFAEAVVRLTSGRHPFVVRVPEEIKENKSLIRIRDVKKLWSYTLKNYLHDRGISLETCTRFGIKEVHFSIGNGDPVFYSIGMPITGGGWALRNQLKKQCSVQGYSHIPTNAATLAVFEGMFDALTYWEVHPESRSVLVLNSVNNAATALAVMERYNAVELWLDNDPAGDAATALLMEKLGNKATDMRWKYEGFNDLNDCYLGIKQEVGDEKES